MEIGLDSTLTHLHQKIQTSTLSDMPEAVLYTSGLEAKYGPVTAEIHEHSLARRVIDIIDSQGISRTHALTWFPQVDPKEDILSKARAEIKAGGLIGKTIEKHGFGIKKLELSRGIIEIPDWLRQRFLVAKKSAQYSIYQFIAHTEEKAALFGVVCEIYSPDYISPEKSQEQLTTDKDSEPFIAALRDYLSSTL